MLTLVYPLEFTFIVGVILDDWLITMLLCFLKYVQSSYLSVFIGTFNISDIQLKGKTALGLLLVSG